MVTLKAKQKGATLMISLIMLVVLTLLVVAAINMTSTNLRVASNMQMQAEATAAAQQAIENLISTTAPFYTPSASTVNIDINHDGTNDYAVSLDTPKCLSSTPSPGYSAGFAASAPQDTYWDIKATATNNSSGANVTIHQGVKIKLAAGSSCP